MMLKAWWKTTSRNIEKASEEIEATLEEIGREDILEACLSGSRRLSEASESASEYDVRETRDVTRRCDVRSTTSVTEDDVTEGSRVGCGGGGGSESGEGYEAVEIDLPVVSPEGPGNDFVDTNDALSDTMTESLEDLDNDGIIRSPDASRTLERVRYADETGSGRRGKRYRKLDRDMEWGDVEMCEDVIRITADISETTENSVENSLNTVTEEISNEDNGKLLHMSNSLKAESVKEDDVESTSHCAVTNASVYEEHVVADTIRKEIKEEDEGESDQKISEEPIEQDDRPRCVMTRKNDLREDEMSENVDYKADDTVIDTDAVTPIVQMSLAAQEDVPQGQAGKYGEGKDSVDTISNSSGSTVRICDDIIEAEPEQVIHDVIETEDVLQDGTVVRKREVRSEQRQTVTQRFLTYSDDLDDGLDDITGRRRDSEAEGQGDEEVAADDVKTEESEEIMDDGSIIKRKITTTTKKELIEECVENEEYTE